MLATAPPPLATTGRTFQIDLRGLSHSTHQSLVFERLDQLGPDDSVVVVSEDEPRILRWQIDAWWPRQFDWAWQETGPLAGRAEITRRA